MNPALQRSEAYTSLYADARGVCRVMQMTFDGTVWRLWRDAPGFFQRYEGRLAGDGRTVTGAWERSPDGVDWQHDFDLVYERAG